MSLDNNPTGKEKELHTELNKRAMYIVELQEFLTKRNPNFNANGLYHMRTEELSLLHESIVNWDA